MRVPMIESANRKPDPAEADGGRADRLSSGLLIILPISIVQAR
jgi:hypothetical protein